MKCLIYKLGVWWRANILSGVTWAHTDNPRQTKQTVWLPESLLQVPSHCVYIRLFQKKKLTVLSGNVPVQMKPFLPYFFCCDVIAPTYCLSAERLSAHRSVWKDKKTRSLLKAGGSSQWDFLLKWGAPSEEVVLKSPGGEEAAACSA